MLERVWRRDSPYALCRNVNWYYHYGEQYGDSLKTKNRASISSSNDACGHIYGENDNLKRYMHPSVHCSTIYNSMDMETA